MKVLFQRENLKGINRLANLRFDLRKITLFSNREIRNLQYVGTSAFRQLITPSAISLFCDFPTNITLLVSAKLLYPAVTDVYFNQVIIFHQQVVDTETIIPIVQLGNPGVTARTHIGRI